MLRVSIIEFRKKLSYYIDICSSEDVAIIKNGETVAILSSRDKEYQQNLDRLCGCLKDSDEGKNYRDMIGEEIMKRCGC